MIDVNPNHLETVTRILAGHVPECEVRAFGSRVTWTAKDYSDLDLAVVGERALDFDALRRLKEAFEESNLPFRVDVLDWHAISSTFRKVIEKKYEVVQKGKQKSLGMAGEWVDCKLADACGSIDYGLTAPAADTEVGPRFLRITDIVSGHIDWNTVPHVAADEETSVKYRLDDGDIVLARTGASTGASSYVKRPPPAVFASYLVRLKAKPDFDARFLAYYLKSDLFWSYIRGVLGDKSAQPNASASTMTQAPLRAPRNKDEQRAIAHILGTLDDKIELNRRMSETLEAMARGLFKSWFVDFDPVRAKAEGRDPGLPKPLADLFPERLVDSELGEIPEGWEVAPLPELIDVNPPRSLRKGEIAPYLDMANMPTRGHAPDAVVDRPFGSGTRFINGDTLVARITPCLENGKTAFVDFLKEGPVGWGSTEYIVLRPKPPLPEEFAYCLARSEAFREFAIQSMTGSSGRQRVPAESLAHYQLPVAPRPIAAAFGRLVKPHFARASAGVGESRTLAALRDALLPKLISGDLRLKDAERFAAGVGA